jgi:hypothetical protein
MLVGVGGAAAVLLIWAMEPTSDGKSMRSDKARCVTTVPASHRDSAIYAEFPGPEVEVVPVRAGQAQPYGTYPGEMQADGTIRIKVLWRRTRSATGPLAVTGRRTDGGEGTLRASVDANHDSEQRFSAFVPSSLFFSSPGCWRIEAVAGSESVEYTVEVADPAWIR